ncbi:cell wall metabolism sensor histidine kinase WalK [Pleionea sp. CnH1-48]|uniref:sensor histidine kinase n=1 Tax=Pleionea sp. CnH1-48 TaxID=2954494 RepID=UPI002096EB2C|nr:ATP-binding protein [Pleionea sp. CnH1-48]MCO7224911.1 ATP-binding protein [Pleionea sp. CnH1-48]
MSGITYLYIALFLINIMLSAIFFLVWKNIERQPYTLTWACLFVVSTLNFVINALNSFFPNKDLYWIFVNATSLIIQALAYVGFRQRAGLKAWPRELIIYLIAVESLIAWFTVVQPHTGLSMVFAPYSAAVLLSGAAWTLIRVPRKIRASEKATAAIFFCYAFIQWLMGTVALLQGAEPNSYYYSYYQMINHFSAAPALVGLGLFTVFILAEDMSHRMRRLANNIEQMYESKKQLSADISHELRTPLSVLRIHLEALEEGISEPEESYGMLRNKIEQIDRLINDLYFLSKADVNQLQFVKEVFPAVELFRELELTYKTLAAERGLEFSIDVQLDDELEFLGDYQRLLQVLGNLMNNSLQYTDKGGETRMSVKALSSACLIIIDDTKPGVSDEDLPKLFERMFRVDASRNRRTGGSGLGLSICKAIIEAHHGDIRAEQSPLGGLRIICKIPMHI